MKIVVLGAGAIGGIAGGYLKKKGADVSLVTRGEAVERIIEHGLRISGVRGETVIHVPAHANVIEKPDLVILGTKTQDIARAVEDNYAFIRDALILTIQNGVRADEIVSRYFPVEKILSSIVMFGATYIEPGVITHNFEGKWIIGSAFSPKPGESLISLSMILDEAFEVMISEDIRGMKYLKIFVNANNCIPAILGVSMQEAFSDLAVSRISIALWKEGFDIVSGAGIKLTSLPGFPVENVTKLTSLSHDEAAKVFSGIMVNLSRDPLYGSVLQSIKRDRLSEIDYINGEFVALAEAAGRAAPLNRKLCEMVHMVETGKRFYTRDELLAETKDMVPQGQ